ncbi:MAG: transglutaminase family protein [Anaerolineae bacterium]|nr:transglutaminase family protein [Anaerolineae bacterium]
MHYRITHTTAYQYEDPASLSFNEARLLPRTFETPLFSQKRLTHEVVVSPFWRDARERQDCYGNDVLYFTMRQAHSEMKITVTSEVELTPKPLPMLSGANWEAVRATLLDSQNVTLLPLREFMLDSPLVPLLPEIRPYAAMSFGRKRPLLEATHDLMQRIYTDFTYQPGTTTITTPLRQVLAEKSGVCQDYAHFMLACLRLHGLAARYVSGYIETELEGSAASHAWVSVFVPDLGWVDFDPTNNLMPHDQHITLGWGRDFSDVTPLKGIFYGGGESELAVAVDVVRLTADGAEEPKASANGHG